jgi:hypothetical protein
VAKRPQGGRRIVRGIHAPPDASTAVRRDLRRLGLRAGAAVWGISQRDALVLSARLRARKAVVMAVLTRQLELLEAGDG